MTHTLRGTVPLRISVNFACGIATFLHIIEDHWLNDLQHITQFSSKWQLAPFYETVAIRIINLHSFLR
jgi:hypothetical protein